VERKAIKIRFKTKSIHLNEDQTNSDMLNVKRNFRIFHGGWADQAKEAKIRSANG
jgi:hypothetical protein